MAKKKTDNEEQRENVLDIIKILAKELGIDEEELITSLEEGIVSAFRREFDGEKTSEKAAEKDKKPAIKNVQAEIDRETGEISVYKIVEVVDEVVDSVNEISIEEAKALDEDFEVGDELELAVDVSSFGRLAATAAKQVASSKIRMVQNKAITARFANKKDEIIAGTITYSDNKRTYIDVGKAEAILKKEDKVKTERYNNGETMKFVVKDFDIVNDKYSIVLSRISPALVEKLFKLEVPEVADGTVSIMNVAREPGSRSKIAVYSANESVDAKGACVGPRGQRVQAVMEELRGEKIDIVEWNEDPAIFIKEALQPANVLRVDTVVIPREDGGADKLAKVVVPDNQFTLAIGKSGQNARLAARLTGYRIDICKESDDAAEATKSMMDNFQVVEEE